MAYKRYLLSCECARRSGCGMNEEAHKLLEKASHAIRAAEALIQIQEPDSAAGRLYYAMFYVIGSKIS